MDFSIKKVAEIVDIFLKAFRTEPILRAESATENGHGRPEISIDDEGLRQIQQLFLSDEDGIPFLQNLDSTVYSNDGLMPLGEYMMDFGILKLMVQASAHEDVEALFESDYWMELEEKTLERGTELLNVLVYLKDCIENHVRPSLNDFLNEFLLVGEDGFQDEFEIYEPFIKNDDLLDANIKTILSTGEEVADDDIRDLFAPMMIFFKNAGKNRQDSMDQIRRFSVRPRHSLRCICLAQCFHGFE